MARKLNCIADITETKGTWKLHVRVMNLFTIMKYNSPNEVQSLEAILIDKTHGRIQATVSGQWIEKFSKLLLEGKTYIMGNFAVASNDGRFRYSKHRCRLFFHGNTVVKEFEGHSIPKQVFEWSSLDDIMKGTINDVFAQIINLRNDSQYIKFGVRTRRIVIELQDASNATLSCTLFGVHAEQLAASIENINGKFPFIAIHLLSIREYQGEIQLSNSMYGSKLFIDPDFPEVIEFKRSKTPIAISSSTKTSQLSWSSTRSSTDDFLTTSKRKTIVDLKNSKEIGSAVIVATVCNLQTSFPWYYIACSNCTKKVDTTIEIKSCKYCYTEPITTIPKYRVQLEVDDITGTVDLVLFDSEVEPWVNKSAAQLLQEIEADGDLTELFPEALDVFLGKTFLFLVKIQETNTKQKSKSFTVSKMTDN